MVQQNALRLRQRTLLEGSRAALAGCAARTDVVALRMRRWRCRPVLPTPARAGCQVRRFVALFSEGAIDTSAPARAAVDHAVDARA